MASETPQHGESGSKLSRSTGTSSNAALAGTQYQCKHQLVHCEAANAATKNVTQAAHVTIVCVTGSGKNMKQHAIGCESIHIAVNGRQLTVECMVGICRELWDKFFAARKGKPPWSTEALVCTVCQNEHRDVVTSGSFVDKFHDKHPRQGTKQASITSDKTTGTYIVEVVAESDC